jgi:hypothetical protein
MSTSYEIIYKKFYKKLVNDKVFFNYNNLTEVDIQVLVEDHSLALLNDSIDYLYTFDSPDFDFFNKDDALLVFNEDLVPQEISLLAEIMYFKYMEEDKNKLKVLGLTFKSGELEVFSPANDRKTYIEMLKGIEKEVINKITNYFSRNRNDWSFKSIY